METTMNYDKRSRNQAMTEEIRIKVAEAMGLDATTKTICPFCKGNTPYEAGDDYGITIWAKCKKCNNTGKVEPYHTGLPNYPADLNACASFEATLTDEEHREFRNQLGEVVGDVALFCRKMISATAHQRCLAYLKTKGIIQ